MPSEFEKRKTYHDILEEEVTEIATKTFGFKKMMSGIESRIDPQMLNMMKPDESPQTYYERARDDALFYRPSDQKSLNVEFKTSKWLVRKDGRRCHFPIAAVCLLRAVIETENTNSPHIFCCWRVKTGHRYGFMANRTVLSFVDHIRIPNRWNSAQRTEWEEFLLRLMKRAGMRDLKKNIFTSANVTDGSGTPMAVIKMWELKPKSYAEVLDNYMAAESVPQIRDGTFDFYVG